jgi:heme oxygenase
VTQGTIGAVRERTQSVHHRLESRLQLTRAPSVAYYAAYLSRMYGVVQAIERKAAEQADSLSRLPDLADRAHKSSALERDLTDLGVLPQKLPVLSLPELADVAALFGALYVLEGSTLGGTVLARRLEAELGALPTRYLRIYGLETAAKWRTFLAALETFAALDERQRVARAAHRMFETIEAWFEQGGLFAEQRGHG